MDKFCENSRNFNKFGKLSIKIIKNCQILIDFKKLWKILRRPGISAPGPPTRRPLNKPYLGGHRFPPPEKFPKPIKFIVVEKVLSKGSFLQTFSKLVKMHSFDWNSSKTFIIFSNFVKVFRNSLFFDKSRVLLKKGS